MRNLNIFENQREKKSRLIKRTCVSCTNILRITGDVVHWKRTIEIIVYMTIFLTPYHPSGADRLFYLHLLSPSSCGPILWFYSSFLIVLSVGSMEGPLTRKKTHTRLRRTSCLTYYMFGMRHNLLPK